MSTAPFKLRFKQTPEDFLVEELPAFELSGEGEHLYLCLEKRDLSTSEVAARLARTYDLPRSDVGFAGRKDRFAVTRQWFSLAGISSERAAEAEAVGVRVLEVGRNTKKLRLGALAGNRFELTLRGVEAEHHAQLTRQLTRLRERGLPNRFGAQRFGADQRADVLGAHALKRDWRALLAGLAASSHWPESAALEQLRAVLSVDGREGHRGLGRLTRELPRELAPIAGQLARRRGDFRAAVRALDRTLIHFAISALQARLFNRLVDLRGAGLGQPQLGDLVQRHPGRSFFSVDPDQDLAELRERAARLELSPTGAIFGWKSPLATGPVGERERRALARVGLRCADFRRLLPGVSPEGSRRSLRAIVGQLEHSFVAGGLRLRFVLPPGAYATVLIEELQRGG